MASKVIICGDGRMVPAIGDGVIAAELTSAKEEIRQLRAVDGVRREADKKRWQRTQRRLARKYSIKPVGRVRGAILGVWGLLWLSIDETYQYFSAWNRG